MLVIVIAAASGFGQKGVDDARNNPYAPSPAGKLKTAKPDASNAVPNSEVAFVTRPQARADSVERVKNSAPVSAANPSSAISKPLSPTDIYKVGSNDVLYIKLQNAASGSDYYTVRPDGTIDFPLAGNNVVVAGLDITEIETLLKSSIKLFPDPRLEIKIREYASHRVTVSGSLSNPGEKSLQREAVPFFVLKAGAMLTPDAGGVRITPQGQATQFYELGDPKLDNILIFPGTSIEFVTAAQEKYFVTGKGVSTGEKTITRGLTLMQAVVAAGSGGKEPKKAVIRRRNANGILSNLEFDLRSVKSGRIADPTIVAGDIIDVNN